MNDQELELMEVLEEILDNRQDLHLWFSDYYKEYKDFFFCGDGENAQV